MYVTDDGGNRVRSGRIRAVPRWRPGRRSRRPDG